WGAVQRQSLAAARREQGRCKNAGIDAPQGGRLERNVRWRLGLRACHRRPTCSLSATSQATNIARARRGGPASNSRRVRARAKAGKALCRARPTCLLPCGVPPLRCPQRQAAPEACPRRLLPPRPAPACCYERWSTDLAVALFRKVDDQGHLTACPSAAPHQ